MNSMSVAGKFKTHTFTTCDAVQGLMAELTPKIQASMRSANETSKRDGQQDVKYSDADIDAVPSVLKTKLTGKFNNCKTTDRLPPAKYACFFFVSLDLERDWY